MHFQQFYDFLQDAQKAWNYHQYISQEQTNSSGKVLNFDLDEWAAKDKY